MVCAALVARLPTIWAAVGAVCFAVSDALIAVGRFVLDNDALSVPIWWLYAAAQILITAGFFFGRGLTVMLPLRFSPASRNPPRAKCRCSPLRWEPLFCNVCDSGAM